MACPLCGDECHCAPLSEEESSHVSVLIDPEGSDLSEQQFAASLEAPARAGRGNAPLSGASAARPEPPPPAATARDFYRPDDTWRREVSSKVDAYRRRRRRYDPDASLPLNFDATQPDMQPQSPPLPSFARAQAAAQALAEAPKIIEFPRPAPAAEELAEPLVETPRILEAAEAAEEPPQVEPSPPMPAITLPPEPQEGAGAEPEGPELALLVAPVSQRVQAAVVDGVVVLAACAIFAMIFLRLAGETPHGRMALALASLVPSFFWAVYQYLFLVYAGTTPGMQAAQLSLETFEGTPPARRVRRFRALAMAVSCMSLGLGYLWALVDEDRLCWHDRITRTYLV